MSSIPYSQFCIHYSLIRGIIAGMKHPLLFVFLSFLALVTLALVGQFRALFTLPILAAHVVSLGWYLWVSLPRYSATSTVRSAAVLSVFFLGILTLVALVLPSTNGWTGGRDQGSYLATAYTLSHTGTLSHSDTLTGALGSIYDAGRALQYPGFSYNVLGGITTAFPLGYSVYLAPWVQMGELFGDSSAIGITLAMALLITLSIFLLFILIHTLTRSVAFGVLGAVFYTLAYQTLWVSTQTLSENLARIFLLLVLITLVRYFQTKQKSLVWLASLAALTLAMVRVEGWWVWAVVSLYGLYSQRSHLKLFLKTHWDSVLLIVAFITTYALVQWPFVVAIGRGVFGDMLRGGTDSSSGSMWTNLATATVDNLTTLTVYGLLPLVAGSLLGLAWYIYCLLEPDRRRAIGTLAFFILLLLPYISYVAMPQIAGDTPWLLRRYDIVLLISIVTLLTLIRLAKSDTHRSLLVFPFMLGLALTLLPYTASVPLTPSNGVAEVVEYIQMNVAQEDALLVDRASLVPGSDTSTVAPLISTPLIHQYGYTAAYLTQPLDIGVLLSSRPYVYVLTTESKLTTYQAAYPTQTRVVDSIPYSYTVTQGEGLKNYPTTSTISGEAMLIRIDQ